MGRGRESKLWRAVFFLHFKNSNARGLQGAGRETNHHLCLQSSVQPVKVFKPAHAADAF